MALEREESRALAAAFANVQQFYPQVQLLNAKHQALFGLGVVATRIYGKRILAVVNPPSPKATPQPRAPEQEAIDQLPPASSWFAPETSTKQ